MADRNLDALKIDRALIVDPGNDRLSFDIKNSVTDIEIFEHLDKPYLTGSVTFMDNVGVIDALQLAGVETFMLRCRYPDNPDKAIDKKFTIDKVVSQIKNNDKSELVTLHFVEQIYFISNHLNVNKAYTGKCREIIEKIFEENFVDYYLSEPDNDETEVDMKLIVPNMRPLEACNWVKDRATSKLGMPFYLYSTIGQTDLIHFIPLSTLLNSNSVHDPYEFTYSQQVTSTSADNQLAADYNIKNYELRNSTDISNLIDLSLVGAQHEFWSIDTAASQFIVPFNVRNAMAASGIDTASFIYKNDYKYQGKALEEIKSRKQYHIYASGVYYPHLSHREPASWQKLVTSKAFRNLVTSQPIDINVSGRAFINKGRNRTIGETINLRFLDNSVDDRRSLKESTDTVKSGKHLIYAARHNIRKERYDVTLSCVKLENLK